jgi:hypothetical protein
LTEAIGTHLSHHAVEVGRSAGWGDDVRDEQQDQQDQQDDQPG